MVLDLIELDFFHLVMELVEMFEIDMISSLHIDKKKDVLILGKDPTQELEYTLTAE